MSNTTRLQQLLEMLQSEPHDVFLNYALAMEYLSVNDYPQSEIAFQKVLQLQPSHIPSFYQLGKICEALNQNEKALSYYRQGLELAREQKHNKAINEFGEAIFMLED